MWWALLVLALPAMMILIDGIAGVRARDITYLPGYAADVAFRVLVPIWGDVRYLMNLDYLHPYGDRVTLCTTGDETPAFYEQLAGVAAAHGFRVFRAKPTGVTRPGGQRSTGGTNRDLIIRDALAEGVSEPFVVPLDADSVPSGPLAVPVAELARRRLDLASVPIMPSAGCRSWLGRLQWLEYRLAMQIKYLCPFMLSGACHVARTEVLTDVMTSHSLFFQGNDVETGLLAERLGYRVGFIPFIVHTDVPERLRPWLRQRLAWAGGQFRLFIVNIRFARWHPLLWAYGTGVTWAALALRWQQVGHLNWRIAAAMVGYALLVLFLYSRKGAQGAWWVLAMPAYVLVHAFVIVPLGIAWYAKMAIGARNPGWITTRRGRTA
jgi:hypothetical protein